MVFLVVMAFMQTTNRQDWYVPTVIHRMPTMAACEAVGQAMQQVEKRVQYRCVQSPN
jgi:hypothetical protein